MLKTEELQIIELPPTFVVWMMYTRKLLYLKDQFKIKFKFRDDKLELSG